MYTKEDVINYVEEENVKFIRLTFFDVYGKQKNISIQPSEIRKAFSTGIVIDGSAVFDTQDFLDLYLVPDPTTMAFLPWRSFDGAVIRLYCEIFTVDGKHFEQDTRYLLKKALQEMDDCGLDVHFGAKFDFYLFHENEDGTSIQKPLDYAGYMDIAPEDKGEDVRRQICFYLAEMGLEPESSHHEEGPGQNEIDFHSSPALIAADEAATFKWVVRIVAQSHGLFANFNPKPIEKAPGNAMNINITMTDHMDSFMAGILSHLEEMTLFLNPIKESYHRLNDAKAPGMIGYSKTDCKQVIHILPDIHNRKRMEFRSSDNMCNPYLAYLLILQAGLDGIQKELILPSESDFKRLPETINEAKRLCQQSEFIKKIIPETIIQTYCK